MTENTDKRKIFLSIIIPAYNEEKRITNTLSRVLKFTAGKGYECEIIVVDDGSTDNTAREVLGSGLAGSGKLRLIQNGTNRGKGFSVRRGIAASAGEFVLLSDADMSTPVDEVDKLFKYMDKDVDIVIGSRSVKGAQITLSQPWHRRTMGKVFNVFVRSFVLNGYKDTQCGFKLFRGDTAREISGAMKIDGFCFDVEMLYIARGKGAGIKEIGVEWGNFPQSKVKIFGSSANMFLDLFRILKIHR